MRHTISKDKLFKILERFFFIGFVIASVWFASGVFQHFISRKTSFSQHKEKFYSYPVISIRLFLNEASEIKSSDLKIKYWVSGMRFKQGSPCFEHLKIGENQFYNPEYNKTEKVILESLEDFRKLRVFRIIHLTPILKKTATGKIQVEVKKNTTFKSNKKVGQNLEIPFFLPKEMKCDL